MSNEFLDPDACSGLTDGNLFYPSCGRDTEHAIKWFKPWIRDFWFVDCHCPLTPQFTTQYPLEEARQENLTGITLRKRKPFCVTIRHERYRWSDNEVVNIHRCLGMGYDTFRAVFKSQRRKISIFYYRGDGMGEGGSGFLWLGEHRIWNVMECLEPNGLVVSDGTNSIPEFACLRRCGCEISSENRPAPFEVASRRFVCVGYLGPHRGSPTIVWKAININ